MRNRFDQFAKSLLRRMLTPAGALAWELEVSTEAQRIDVLFVPDAGREAAGPPAELGLLGRMASGACLFEPYHGVPSVEEVTDCVRKHLQYRHEARKGRGAGPTSDFGANRAPRLFILSSGRPERAMRDWRFEPASPAYPTGVYTTVGAVDAWLLVLGELPRSRDTLLLRLLGAGEGLRQATGDLLALPEDAFERVQLVPEMIRYRFDIPADTQQQTPEEQDFIMNTHETYGDLFYKAVEESRRKGLQEGRQEGRQEGLQEGRQEGLQEGRQEGRQEGALEVLARQFEKRIGRRLTEVEWRALTERYQRGGSDRLDDVLFERAGEALAEWLLDASAT